MQRTGWLWPTTIAAISSTIASLIGCALTIGYLIFALYYEDGIHINCSPGQRSVPTVMYLIALAEVTACSAVALLLAYAGARLGQTNDARTLRVTGLLSLALAVIGFVLLIALAGQVIDWNCSKG